jgi:aspartyl protease family protein
LAFPLLVVLVGLAPATPVARETPIAATVATRTAPPSLWIEGRATDAKPGQIEIWRNDDGLFYVQGLINGRPVRFLVDTGASMIVLTASDARNVGITDDASTTRLEVGTANGTRAMARVTLDSVTIAGSEAARVPAAVAGDGLQVSLLGLSFLSHIASMTIEGDRMLLHLD